MIRRWAAAAALSLALGSLACGAGAAHAQWSRVEEVPATQFFSLFTAGDTILAGADTSVFLSVDRGASWIAARRIAPGVHAVTAVLVRNGRLYAGTFGQGVFVSDDLGATWQAFNQGLTGGFADSQLSLSGLVVLGDSLYAATEGAGVYKRILGAGGGGGGWFHFGEEFEPNQSSDVSSLFAGGARLLACAGANGTVMIRDPGDSDWRLSQLANTRLLPGFTTYSAAFTGSSWTVATLRFLFHSTFGEEPWTPVDLGIGIVNHAWFAAHEGVLFGAFDLTNVAVIEQSDDGGATWGILDILPGEFVLQMASLGNELYAAQGDGLWRRDNPTTSVPGGTVPSGLRFALLGQPVRDLARFHFVLPRAGSVKLELFDVTGRRQGLSERSWAAGENDWTWNTAALAPGVYTARLTAGESRRAVTLVHLR